jgi:hypothetical protein
MCTDAACVHCDYFVLNAEYFLMTQQPSALILITFEFAIMAVVAVTTLTKYALAVIDMQIEGIWHAKLSYEFALDFISEVSGSGARPMYPCMQQSTAYSMLVESTAYSMHATKQCLLYTDTGQLVWS